jgi:tRNA G18 (ribose-2'-O)-methylase SpoU
VEQTEETAGSRVPELFLPKVELKAVTPPALHRPEVQEGLQDLEWETPNGQEDKEEPEEIIMEVQEAAAEKRAVLQVMVMQERLEEQREEELAVQGVTEQTEEREEVNKVTRLAMSQVLVAVAEEAETQTEQYLLKEQLGPMVRQPETQSMTIPFLQDLHFLLERL